MKRKFAGAYAPMKKRRFTRRRRSMRRGRPSALSSQKGNFTGSSYRTRRMSYRRYKGAVYKSLAFKESSRSVRSLCNNLTTSVLGAGQKEWTGFTLNDDFYTSAGGYTGANLFTTSKFVIKGGKISCMIRNTSANPMRVEFGLVKTLTANGFAGGIFPTTADISYVTGFGQDFKLVSKIRNHILEPGDQCEVTYRLPFTIINDITNWNLEIGKLLIVWAVTNNTAGALTYLNERGHNLTFVADAIA